MVTKISHANETEKEQDCSGNITLHTDLDLLL